MFVLFFLGLELYFETDHCLELHFETDHCPDVPFRRLDSIQRSRVTIFEGHLKTKLKLFEGLEHSISKAGLYLKSSGKLEYFKGSCFLDAIITDEFLQHFEYNAKAKALFVIQQHLMDEDNLVFFTDSLLINANTQAASMSAGFIKISDSNIITHTFTSILENWPSSLRAELFAILLTLIISLHECRVDINTDSQNLINIIQRILNNPTFSIRDYFRLPNNNVIINNIISIIRAKQLRVRFIKVQAHSDNYFNNQIDKACKIAHYDNSPPLIITRHYFDNIHYLPQWDSIPIERKLQRFITYSSNLNQYLSFLHLPQNYKYKSKVNWNLTLQILCNNGEKTETDFAQHHSTCVLCSEEKETFVHIWLCPYQNEDKAYFKLYNQFKNTLLYSILDVKPNEVITQLNHDFENFHLTRSLHLTLFTFLDIIKGYVPSFLVEWLQQYLNTSQVQNILFKAFDKLYEDSLDIWKSRCENFALIEKSSGITHCMKCSASYKVKYSGSYNSYNNDTFIFLLNFDIINLEYIEYINLLIRFNVSYIDLFTYDIS
ncbi:hypothetical protein RclHR1_02740020 [Rhizophagus clarus]|uniref:RNase H type-1 domain-containing protein n=1 Tax=Rhizophagus clarus TaxID=94130 RepID=A0A2Z6RFU1_9GLOM|nr:hypothetical protein RclHR1_02740020 [Rhizophagus clarus]